MKRKYLFPLFMAILSLIIINTQTGIVVADGGDGFSGLDGLGPPLGIVIEPGTDIVVAGTGLITQPGVINIDIPLGVTIKQVLLYWQGKGNQDDTILLDGASITGSLIGNTYADRYCYRADVTAVGFVSPGPNSLPVAGLDFVVNNGAGLMVIYDDGVNSSEIIIKDGDDFAFGISSIPPPYDTTVPQTFSFTPEDVARVANLSMFFASVSGSASGGGFRPSAIEVTVGGTTTVFDDMLDSYDGDEWDTLILFVDIPAQADSLTVQALSVNNPGGQEGQVASFDWLVSSVSVPSPPDGGEGCTPGYWKQKQHFDSWVNYSPSDLFSDVFGPVITIRFGKKKAKIENPTLLEALKAKGGGINALARHTVAALLNASSPDVNYDLSAAEVINEFKAVYPGTKAEYNALKNMFAMYNEQGCPLH